MQVKEKNHEMSIFPGLSKPLGGKSSLDQKSMLLNLDVKSK